MLNTPALTHTKNNVAATGAATSQAASQAAAAAATTSAPRVSGSSTSKVTGKRRAATAAVSAEDEIGEDEMMFMGLDSVEQDEEDGAIASGQMSAQAVIALFEDAPQVQRAWIYKIKEIVLANPSMYFFASRSPGPCFFLPTDWQTLIDLFFLFPHSGHKPNILGCYTTLLRPSACVPRNPPRIRNILNSASKTLPSTVDTLRLYILHLRALPQLVILLVWRFHLCNLPCYKPHSHNRLWENQWSLAPFPSGHTLFL
jgi:hypothetical protein